MIRSVIAAVAGAMLLALLSAGPAAAQDKPPLIVGAIYVGSVNDYGYNRSMKDGLEEMKKNIPGLNSSRPRTCRRPPSPSVSWKG